MLPEFRKVNLKFPTISIPSISWKYIVSRIGIVLFSGLFIAGAIIAAAKYLPDEITLPQLSVPNLSLGTPMVVNADSVNIRSGPSTSYEAIGELNRGDEVTVIGASGGWCRLSLSEYVKCTFLSERGE